MIPTPQNHHRSPAQSLGFCFASTLVHRASVKGCSGVVLTLFTAFSFAAQAQGLDYDTPEPREGIFGGFELALVSANIDPPTEDDFPQLGSQVGLHLGYRWDSGLGFSGGVSGALLDYRAKVATFEADVSVFGDLIDVSAWYFLDLNPTLDVFIRGGVGRVTGSLRAIPVGDIPNLGDNPGAMIPGGDSGAAALLSGPLSGKDFGAVVSAGIGWMWRNHVRLSAEVNWRWFNLDLAVDGFEDSVSLLGLSFGVGWAP